MHTYSSTQWGTLPHFILTSYTYWNPSVIDYTEAEYYAWFDTISDSSKLESHGTFDMHGDYIELTIVQDTEIYYFDYNTYDEDY